MRRATLPLLLLLAALGTDPARGQDAAIPRYERKPDQTGALRTDGSPTLSHLVQVWSDAFRDMYPGFSCDIFATGSLNALPELTERDCDLALISRPITAEEVAAFKKKKGYEPTGFLVGRDAIVVLVNKNNPFADKEGRPRPGLTLKELDSLFSVTRSRGGPIVSRWGELGLRGEWQDLPVRLFSTGKESGTTLEFFRLVMQPGGRYGAKVRVQPGPLAVANAVGSYRNGIGFASTLYQTKRARALPIAATDGGPYVEPTMENFASGKYPLMRSLYVYVDRKPGKPLPELVREFLLFVCSFEGQEDARQAGFVPIDAATAKKNLAALKSEK